MSVRRTEIRAGGWDVLFACASLSVPFSWSGSRRRGWGSRRSFMTCSIDASTLPNLSDSDGLQLISRNQVADIRCLISQPDGVGIHDQFRLPAERRGGCRQAVSCVPSEVCLKPPRAHSFTYAGRELRAPRPSMVVGVEGPADIFRDLSRKPRDATQTQHSATGCSSSPGQLTDGNVVPGRPAALVLGGLFPAVTEYAEVELARRHQRAEHRAGTTPWKMKLRRVIA